MRNGLGIVGRLGDGWGDLFPGWLKQRYDRSLRPECQDRQTERPSTSQWTKP